MKNDYSKKFWESNEKNKVGASAVALYFFILHIWKKNKQKEVEISEYTLASSLKLSRQTIHTAKKRLSEKELISYTAKIGFAAKFQILIGNEIQTILKENSTKEIIEEPKVVDIIAKEDISSKNYPDLKEFLEYVETFDLYSENIKNQAKDLYDLWINNGWKNSIGKPIFNWRNSVKNSMMNRDRNDDRKFHKGLPKIIPPKFD